MDPIDRMVGELAGALSGMVDEDGAPVPGTVLEEVVTGDEDGAAVALHRYARELLGISHEEADDVLGRLASVVDLTASVAGDIDRL